MGFYNQLGSYISLQKQLLMNRRFVAPRAPHVELLQEWVRVGSAHFLEMRVLHQLRHRV